MLLEALESIPEAFTEPCCERRLQWNLTLDHESPLPLYIKMNLHTQTRSKKLITQPYQLGLSVRYNRILQLENQLATSICDVTKEKGLVCPIHFVMDSLPLMLWITWITILPVLQHRTPFMAQALTYFNSPLSPIKDVHKISLHFSQLTQQ